MMRSPRALPPAFCLCLVVSLSVPCKGADATKQNLDLPFDAIGDTGDEGPPPEIIRFYDQTLEADGFFYVVDRSGSMNQAGELDVAKAEIIRNITEFSDRVQFGIVFFSQGFLRHPASGIAADATPAAKSAAKSWVISVQSSPGSCCQAGISAALRMASTSSAKRKVITYVGDGGGTCSGENEASYLAQTLTAITAQNFQRIPIHCIGVLEQPKLNEDFMKKLAALNGGTYTRISRR